jgi:hypothetical protein
MGICEKINTKGTRGTTDTSVFNVLTLVPLVPLVPLVLILKAVAIFAPLASFALIFYGYPPDLQDALRRTVLRWAEDWLENRENYEIN